MRVLALKSLDLTQLLQLEEESFSSPWTREQYSPLLEAQDISIHNIEVPKQVYLDDAAGIKHLFHDAGIKVFGLKKGEILMGYLCVYHSPKSLEMEVYNMAISLPMRGKGLAHILLARILYLAYISGVQDVFLEVREGNTPAISLYKNLGFTISGKRKKYYSAPVEDALLMHLPLQDTLTAIQKFNYFFEEKICNT